MATAAQDPTPTDQPEHTLDESPALTESPALAESWAAFLETRAWLREVVSDDELRAFGFNLEVFDRKTEPGDFPQVGDLA